MPKKAMPKKEMSWEDIGKHVGKKMEKMKDCSSWKKPWIFVHEEHGGGFGRLIFAIAVLYAMSYKGMLTGIPSWNMVLLIIGFALMRF